MKVDDIRPDHLMIDQAQAEQADIDWLVARRDSFVHVACPACGAEDAAALYEKKGLSQVRCRRCSTQYANPRPTAETLGEFYANSLNYAYFAKHIFPASAEARRERMFRPRAERTAEIARSFGFKGGRLLEVGAAYGLFCDEMRKIGPYEDIIALEPTPDLARNCRDLGFETIESPFETVALEKKVDAIAHFEVIEHLFDPGAFLSWCFENLNGNGFVISTCPNIAGLETSVAGEKSNTVDHEHINLFTPQSLQLLLERCGFIAVEISTPGVLDIELLERALAAGKLLEGDVDPIILELIRHPDPRVGAAFLKLLQEAKLTSNMMAVARKPD